MGFIFPKDRVENQKYLSCHHQTNEFLSNLSFSFSRGHQLWHENPKTNAPNFIVREMGPSNFPHRNFIAFQLRMCHPKKKWYSHFMTPPDLSKSILPGNGNGLPFGNPPRNQSTSPGFCTQRNTPGGTSSYYSGWMDNWEMLGFCGCFSPNCFFCKLREMAHGSYLSSCYLGSMLVSFSSKKLWWLWVGIRNQKWDGNEGPNRGKYGVET